MKKILCFFLIALAFNSCKFKDASVGAADSVVGKYTIKSLKDSKGGNFNFPYTSGGITLTGNVEITKLSPTQVNIKLTLEQKSSSGTVPSTQTEPKIDVVKSGSNYNLENSGKSFGTLKGTALNLDFVINKETNTVIAEKNQ
jgi:carbohydrate-binding DOMON domain-containing protein